MTDIKFLDRLKKYDKDNIASDVLRSVGNMVTNKQTFNIERITQANRAAGGLAKWCFALYKYSEALKIVRPKKQKVEEMTLRYNESMAEVRAKQHEVAEIKSKLALMEADL